MSKKLSLSAIRVIKAVCFSVIFALLLAVASYYIKPVTNKFYWLNFAGGIFGEPDNTIEYVVVGSSNCPAGTSPLTIYNQHGYVGYSCGEAWQTPVQTYNMLDLIFKTQSPKLVIIETDSMFDRKNTIVAAESTLRGMFECAFPVVRYHDSWKKMIETGGKTDYSWQHEYRGQRENKLISACNKSQAMSYNGGNDTIRWMNHLYLERIMDMCKEKGAQVMFISVPCNGDWNNARHDTVKKYADKKGVPYIDFNNLVDEIGFDFDTDFRDKGVHLNSSGANKVSKYLGNYLQANYQFTDYRNNSEYERWNIDAEKYMKEYS